MNVMTTTEAAKEGCQGGYVLRFQSLFHEGRAYAFPCDERGHVDLDALSERARINYLYARAVIGREVTMPAVERTVH